MCIKGVSSETKIFRIGTKLLITKFLITEFIITKLLITKFLIDRVPNHKVPKVTKFLMF